MFYVLQNETVAARRRCPILLTDSATGTTGQSGIAISNIYAYVSINGGAFAGGAGTIAEVNFGQYYYQFDASEITTLGLAGIHITAPGCRDYDAIVQVSAFNMYSAAGAGLTAGDVWSYGGGRTITGGTADTVVNPVDVTTLSMTGIANTTWNTDVSAYTAPSAGYDVHNGAAGAGISAYDVWNYVLSDSNTAENDLTNINSKVNTIDLNVTTIYGDVGTINTNTQAANIALAVWSDNLGAGPNAPYASGTAGTILYDLSLGGGGITAGDVWNFTVLGFGTTDSAAQYLTGAYTDSANTYNQLVNFTPADVWSYSGVGGRTITGGIADTVTTLTNRSGFAITGGTITTVSDKTGYSLSASQTFDLTGNITGNVSGSVGSVTNPVSVSTASMSSIANSTWSTDISGYSAPSAGYDLSNVTAGGGISAADVWTYATRTITGGIADTVTTVSGNVLGSVNSVVTDVPVNEASISADVWSYVTRTLTSGGSGISAADVWTYGSRTITGGIADTVTTLTNRSGFAVTGGTVDTVTNGVTVTTNNDKTGYSLSGTQSFNLTGNITGSLSGSVGSVSGNVGGNVVGSVASVTNPVTFNSAQYASIASSVWNAGTRTLTSGGSGISAYDVWNFVLSDANTAEVDLVTAASGAGISAADVWTYGSRTITGGIANTVTSVTNGVTVTTNNDKTGYALSTAGVNAVQSGLSTLTQAQVGTEVDASLADVGLTSTVTGRIDVAVSSRLASSSYTAPPSAASIASSVWSEPVKTITGGTVDTVTNDVNVAETSMTGIAGTTWSYGTRTLTSAAGATAGDVWSYPTRSLTSGAGITVNAATNIINGPYFVKSNVDGQDGTLDVIRGMVQDIQLTVTDAFQNPFDTTALGLLVNFYDQAGTLTTSYATTELYGPAGLVQFTLDTAVTANEGRYNLILSAAGSGNTIKFGPLQTLVRPF